MRAVDTRPNGPLVDPRAYEADLFGSQPRTGGRHLTEAFNARDPQDQRTAGAVTRLDYGTGCTALERCVAVVQPQAAHLHFRAMARIATALKHRSDFGGEINLALGRLRQCGLRGRDEGT